MAKWEYLKVSAWFSGTTHQGIIIRLTPKQYRSEELLNLTMADIHEWERSSGRAG